MDVETGQVRVVIHEENKPYLDYQMRSVSFLKDGKEILFRSERNGWGHYYLYDTATGNLKNQVTDGTWVAGPIAKIDTVGRKFYFMVMVVRKASTLIIISFMKLNWIN